MNGEYLLSLDPYNFNTEEEYVKFYHPDLWDEIEEKNTKIAKGDTQCAITESLTTKKV